jgi:glycerol uptake facilitator-like aquaporin
VLRGRHPIGHSLLQQLNGALWRRAAAEFLGTALLLTAVVGSVVAAQRLSPGNLGLELFENAVATGAALAAIIVAVGPVSGAHLNPVVSIVEAIFGGIRPRELPAYVVAQVAGASVGVIAANLMFSLPAVTVSTKARSSPGLWLGEVIATLGLLLVIAGAARGTRGVGPFAIGAYIAGAYFFTSSTSFANPAVAIAREFTDTFAGISPGSVAPFVIAELVGGALAVLAIAVLFPPSRRATTVAVIRHATPGEEQAS